MPLQLHYQSSGETRTDLPALVILHGLFGNTDNWASRASEYAGQFRVIRMDLRNHGNSPHHEIIDYSSMAGDVIRTLDELAITSCHLLGHSMGGKVAMQIACNHPQIINKLVIVDIAPKAYEPSHNNILQAMLAIDTRSLKSRSQADECLAQVEADPAVRAFLLKNLQRDSKGYRWQLNLQGIARGYPELLKAPELGQPCEKPTLFIKGADSDYLQTIDTEIVQRWFPRAELKIIDGAGHWPHASKPTVFDHILNGFLV